MDLFVKIGLYFLSLTFVAFMLLITIDGQEKINDTQGYVTKQNESDAYASRYASLSSFNVDSVGKIEVQDALNIIFTYAQADTPVIVKGPDGIVHVYVNDNSGWLFSSSGKPLGRKIDSNGNYYDDAQFNTNIGAIDVTTEQVPEYAVLYNYLANNHATDVKYMANINPDNEGNLDLILLVATY